MQKSSQPIFIQLSQEADLGQFTEIVRAVCTESRFDRIDTEKMVLACSEIAHNTVRHGGGGLAEVSVLKDGKLVRVTITDEGPGIHNIQLALREGYSTLKTSLGLGLESAQRLADHFEISSSSKDGTKIVLEKHRPLAEEVVDYGLVSVPDDRYNYNGDQYVLKEYDGDSTLLGVIDGPGQGYDAFSIAQSCKQFVEDNYKKPLIELLTALNILMQESVDEVGITVSLVRITPHSFSYIGLGDSHAYCSIDGSNFVELQNQDGRVGYVTKVKDLTYNCKFDKKVSVILCSDGIKRIDHVTLDNTAAQIMANNLFDTYHRPNGDATILTSTYTL